MSRAFPARTSSTPPTTSRRTGSSRSSRCRARKLASTPIRSTGGTCGRVCPVAANAEPACVRSACKLVCHAGTADCNANASDGCEAVLATDPSNCGACRKSCAAPNGTGTCDAGRCAFQCASGFSDCDGVASNGCETAGTCPSPTTLGQRTGDRRGGRDSDVRGDRDRAGARAHPGDRVDADSSGPSPVVFSAPSALTTTVKFLAPGTYVLQVEANDGFTTASARLTVTASYVNRPPQVSVGADQTLAPPAMTARLSGSATDDGLPLNATLSATWSLVSGPVGVTIRDPDDLGGGGAGPDHGVDERVLLVPGHVRLPARGERRQPGGHGDRDRRRECAHRAARPGRIGADSADRCLRRDLRRRDRHEADLGARDDQRRRLAARAPARRTRRRRDGLADRLLGLGRRQRHVDRDVRPDAPLERHLHAASLGGEQRGGVFDEPLGVGRRANEGGQLHARVHRSRGGGGRPPVHAHARLRQPRQDAGRLRHRLEARHHRRAHREERQDRRVLAAAGQQPGRPGPVLPLPIAGRERGVHVPGRKAVSLRREGLPGVHAAAGEPGAGHRVEEHLGPGQPVAEARRGG